MGPGSDISLLSPDRHETFSGGGKQHSLSHGTADDIHHRQDIPEVRQTNTSRTRRGRQLEQLVGLPGGAWGSRESSGCCIPPVPERASGFPGPWIAGKLNGLRFRSVPETAAFH